MWKLYAVEWLVIVIAAGLSAPMIYAAYDRYFPQPTGFNASLAHPLSFSFSSPEQLQFQTNASDMVITPAPNTSDVRLRTESAFYGLNINPAYTNLTVTVSPAYTSNVMFRISGENISALVGFEAAEIRSSNWSSLGLPTTSIYAPETYNRTNLLPSHVTFQDVNSSGFVFLPVAGAMSVFVTSPFGSPTLSTGSVQVTQNGVQMFNTTNLAFNVTVESARNLVVTSPIVSHFEVTPVSWSSLTLVSIPTRIASFTVDSPSGRINTLVGGKDLLGVEKVDIEAVIQQMNLANSIKGSSLSLVGVANSLTVNGHDVSRPDFLRDLLSSSPIIAIVGGIVALVGFSGGLSKVLELSIGKRPHLAISGVHIRNQVTTESTNEYVLSFEVGNVKPFRRRPKDATKMSYQYAIYSLGINGRRVLSRSGSDTSNDILVCDSVTKKEYRWEPGDVKHESMFEVIVRSSCAESVTCSHEEKHPLEGSE